MSSNGPFPKTPPAHHEAQMNPFEASLALQTRPRVHKRTATGFLPTNGVSLQEVFPEGANAEAWKNAQKRVQASETINKDNIETKIVGHIYNTLGRSAFNADDLTTYQAVAHTVRDKLLSMWNTSQTYQTMAQKKKVWYLSFEFLQGRALDNAIINLRAKPEFSDAIKELGFNMEDLIDCERDAGLGNGGLGRLASCFVDSMATSNIPGFGYSLRYQYGIFMQKVDENGNQIEVPDPYLENSNPWEVARPDNAVEVRLNGQARRLPEGKGRGEWTGGHTVLAVPYDLPIPGYKTNNMSTVRLWSAQPKRPFDLSAFNRGNYDGAVAELNDATLITRVLYPNDNTSEGKALRLKQQYFWVSASLHDVVRRFTKLDKPWTEFPELNAIQLNDTHPTLSIPEFMRVLVDEEGVPWDEAWDIVVKSHAFTNHTVMPEALEKWPVPLLQDMLPRILQIIFDINMFHLQAVEKRWPGDIARLGRMSIIEESHPQQARMGYLAIVGSHHVNGVAALHSDLVKEMFSDFVELYGADHFGNVTNGITPRRWLLQANPSLAALITKTLGSDDWVSDLPKLKGLEAFAKDAKFQDEFYRCKTENKARLSAYIKTVQGRDINKDALFDIQVKRIHEYKRQTLNIFGCIYRYLMLKEMSPEERKQALPRVSIFAGKAAPGYYIAKLVIRLINSVGKAIEKDPDISTDLFQVVFLADYCVSLAEIITPASDISEHISTAGTEGSGTSNMKFCLNGGLLLGTVDGANIEIAEEVGDDNIFMFGNLSDKVPQIRYQNQFHPEPLCPELQLVFDEVRRGTFGVPNVFEPLLNTITQGHDYYLINADFQSYIEAQKLLEREFTNKRSWIEKAIMTTARMGKFSSDRCIMEYAETIWNAEPVPVPDSF